MEQPWPAVAGVQPEPSGWLRPVAAASEPPEETMDFFERQDQARRGTSRLVFLFGLAVAGIATAVYAAVWLVFMFSGAEHGRTAPAFWQPDLFLYTTAGALVVILGGSLFKIAELSQGGRAVATMLGGRPVSANPSDLDEKKLRNVVEEMALASGTPVPEIYLLEQEDGINAFAAGFSTKDVVIGVTRGCIRNLSRDELQGVIAHEFSHILNGDMRLNLRLMGVVYGILCLAIVGRILLNTRGRKNPLPILGLALVIIGGIGMFFGQLIKSAVSRQREFLADASAVQFTRNPQGIAGALKKIGGLAQGARLQAPNAEEASHLFFGNGIAASWSSLFSTHPPLAQRIRAIDPSFDGHFPEVAPEGPDSGLSLLADESLSPFAPSRPAAISPDRFMAQAGQLTPGHFRQAQSLLADIPEPVTSAVRDADGAVATLYAIVLDPDPAARAPQMQLLSAACDPSLVALTQSLFDLLQGQPERLKLPIIDLAIPALRYLAREQYAQFMRNLRGLIESDQQINLFEYTVQVILRRHLEPYYEKTRLRVNRHRSLQPVQEDCAVLLSALAALGQSEPEATAAAFELGVRQLDLRGARLQLLGSQDWDLNRVDTALNRLAELSPMLKKNLLFACAHTAAADGRLEPTEAELMRIIADALDCPIPPILEAIEAV
jgi:Zn-dependent protease with chaperone function/uncharacterized tellurite resistance protein B-like protein